MTDYLKMTDKLTAYDFWAFPLDFPLSFVSDTFDYLDLSLRYEFYQLIKKKDPNYSYIDNDRDDLTYLPLFGVCIGQCTVSLMDLYPLCCCKNRVLENHFSKMENPHIITPRTYPVLKEFKNESPSVFTYYDQLVSEFKSKIYPDRDYHTLKENIPIHEISNPNLLVYYQRDVEYFSSCWRYFLRRRYLQLKRKKPSPEMVGR